MDFSDFAKNISSDTLGKIRLDSIQIYGNNKTKNYIILRELNIKVGDALLLSELNEQLLLCKQAIYNTNLFSEVKITPEIISAFRFKLNIYVTERWYIYPIPQFQIIDRNFNEWFHTYNANFNRLVYGLKYKDYNFSGRADKLNVVFLNGYNRYFALGYAEPYSNKKLNQGFSLGIGLTQNKEFAYKTNYNNKLIFYKKDFFVKNNLFVSGTFFLRKGLYKKHLFGFQYNAGNISDSFVIKNYNRNYLNDSVSNIHFPDFSYSFLYVKTDNVNYPLKGTIFVLGIGKRGLGLKGGINMLSADIVYKKFYTHKNHFYSNIQLASKIKLPFNQAYINQRALGYGDYYLRGLEYYVVDGTLSSIAKLTFSKKLFKSNIHIPIKSKFISSIPLSVYSKAYGDLGYAYNKNGFNTLLNNKVLYTGGFGFDIISLYDMKISIEFSINQLNEKGVFLHTTGVL